MLIAVIANYLYILATSTPPAGLHLRYRLSLVVFLFNVYVLKKIQYISNISRFALALVVNFALYSALFTT
ncbi:MAG: hypothetical protein LBD11_03020 [Candidatus Peribacteria bacterium]|nr:hypothetical protein [Candidatus Peribacteria bacterium]